MPITEVIRVAFQSIRANLFRASLTMLGIVIGVGAVITMLAAGAGAQQRIEAQLAALGSNILTVSSREFFARGVARDQQTLTANDVSALEAAPILDAVVPEIERRNQLKLGNANANARVVGTTPEYYALFNYRLTTGRFFSADDDVGRRRVAVVGAEVPQRLATSADRLVGQTIGVGGQLFEVIGVLQSVGGGPGNQNPDAAVFIPLQTAVQRVMGTDLLSNISVRVKPGIGDEQAMVDIERVLRREHRIAPGRPNDFSLVDRRQFLATQQEAQQTFTTLLASIAGVSLLVGGIGIMNIMLVTVTERTREIGIRMALGATRLNILLQFLVESVTLCLFGGLIGIGAGIGSAALLSRHAGWQTAISPMSVALAFAFSISVGLFFGLWPARRASRLDPIEALRYE
jgi:putative ABC transport system permease protein